MSPRVEIEVTPQALDDIQATVEAVQGKFTVIGPTEKEKEDVIIQAWQNLEKPQEPIRAFKGNHEIKGVQTLIEDAFHIDTQYGIIREVIDWEQVRASLASVFEERTAQEAPKDIRLGTNGSIESPGLLPCHIYTLIDCYGLDGIRGSEEKIARRLGVLSESSQRVKAEGLMRIWQNPIIQSHVVDKRKADSYALVNLA